MLIIILLIPGILFSSSGADFLKIGISPRALGMGAAHVAVCDDVTSTYWNPAGLVKVRYSEIFLSHQNWYYDSNYEYLGYANRFNFGSIGLYMGYFHIPTFDEIGDFGESLGKINIYDMVIGGSYSRYIRGIAFGLNTKYIYRRLDDMGGNAFAFDIGMQKGFNLLKYFKSGNYNFKIGAVLNNIGTDVDFGTCKERLPSSIKFGIKYIPFSSQMNRITFAADFEKLFYEGEGLNLGIEYNFKKILFARAGYRMGKDEGGFTFSGGTVMKIGSTDMDLSLSYFNLRQDTIIATALTIKNKDSKSVYVASPPRVIKPKKGKLSVAVLNFNNLTEDKRLDYLSAATAETISTYIASSALFEVIEKREFDKMLKPLGNNISTSDISLIGKKFNLDAVVIGSFIYSNDLIRINIKIVDVKSSTIIAASFKDGKLGKGIFQLMDETAKNVIEQLKNMQKK